MAAYKFLKNIFLYLSFTYLCHDLVGAQILKQSCINGPCSAKRITISNPPINLWTPMSLLFNEFMLSLQDQNDTKVVVFDNANPDF